MIVEGNNYIAHHIKNNISILAGKIGVTELNLLNPMVPSKYITNEVEDIAGLYPLTEETREKFKKDIYDALNWINLIPRWNRVHPAFETEVFEKYCKGAMITNLQHLEPYFFDRPWTDQLTGKKVIVISPFADSIGANFKKLDKIWNGKIKPNFKLITLKYPFALKIAPHSVFKTSEEVYQFYLDAMSQIDFDVCITGTGYTSLMLAAQAKKMGKIGIHLGGATQILFGIKGQRWREIKEFQPLFNEHWTDPLDIEKPDKRSLVEGGCYW